MESPQPNPLIATLPATVPFVGPEVIERSLGKPFKALLGANENGFGPSRGALDAMQLDLDTACRYGDSSALDLRQALATTLDVNTDNIQIGEGIDGLLGHLVRIMVEPGTPVVSSLGAYPTFHYHVQGYGGELHTVPYRDDHEDIDALLSKAHDCKARVIYLANPDNPMGSWHPPERIEAMISDLPGNCLLILDEAYAEFAPSLPVIPINQPNLIRMRTFSKAYGLAGLRIGYALGPVELMALFDRVRNHFGVNRLAQIAAVGALHDVQWLQRNLEQVRAARERIASIARASQFEPLCSHTNFVAIDMGGAHDGSDQRAANTVRALAEHGVFVRMPGVAGLNRCIRVSVGTDEELAWFEQALKQL